MNLSQIFRSQGEGPEACGAKRLSILILSLSFLGAVAAQAASLDLTYSAISLPGAPAQILPIQLDDDPELELAIVVAYTSWNEIVVGETSEIDDVSGLVEVLTIVPALFDRRELWAFDRDSNGTWTAILEPLDLGTRVLTLEAIAHPEIPLAALTDDGLIGLSLDLAAEEPAWIEETLVDERPILADTRSFLPGLEWSYNLDGDPWPDVLFPGNDGWTVYLGTAEGVSPQPVQTLARPAFDDLRTPRRLDLSLPEVRDVDGDGRRDILLPHPSDGWTDFGLYRNLGGGRFTPASRPLEDHQSDSDTAPLFALFDDLDGDHRAEYVRIDELELDDEAGMRDEMAHAKRPPHRYEVIPATSSLEPAAAASVEFQAIGYAVSGDSEIQLPGGFWDLDGDGRRDLITVTLDFSMMQAVRILVAKSLNIGLDFHLHCQQPDGRFRKVEGLDLSGRFRLDLKNFKIGQLSLFGGDFDGDGRKDFVQIGRGKKVSIHRGAAGCRFPAAPDLILELVEAPKDLALVQVRDLDGDGLADLSVVQPERSKKKRRTSSVRLDLYMSDSQR